MKVLIDTNICIALMRGHARAAAHLLAFTPGDCAISTVTAYELFTGVAKCRESERERSRVLRLLSVVRMVAFDQPAVERAAEVRAKLEKTGNVCGPYDIRLAGHALALSLSIATHNVGEFARVEGLQVDDWLA